MVPPRQKTDEPTQPRLYLLTPAATDIAALKLDLLAALASADIAAVLLRLPDEEDDRSLINRVKALAPTVQRGNAALILDGHPALVARSGADGAHLRSITEFEESVDALKPDRIAGAGGLDSRHDAMIAAEGGADYVMFGEPNDAGARPSLQAVVERVSWWAEVFEAPCVGCAASLDEIAVLAEAGADFVAVGDFIFSDPRGVTQAIADAASRLAVTEQAT